LQNLSFIQSHIETNKQTIEEKLSQKEQAYENLVSSHPGDLT